MAYVSFMYRGARVSLDGDPLTHIEDIHTAWLVLQNLKLSSTQDIKIRNRAGRALVRSYHGRDEIFLAHIPEEVEVPEIKEEKVVYTPMLYPAIIVWHEEQPTDLVQVGFITSHVPGTLQPPFKFWKISDITKLRLYSQKNGWGDDTWLIAASDAYTETMIKEIGVLGYYEFEGNDIRWDLINPVWESSWAPYPENTTDEERVLRWTGGPYEIYLHYSVGDGYFWIGRKPAEHKGGFIYQSGICLANKIENVWEKLISSCDLIESPFKTQGVPTTEGWFTGHQGLPWAQSVSAIDMEYYAINRQDAGNYAAYLTAKANQAILDVWRWCFPGCGTPCDQSVPHWGNKGWWDELDHPLESTWPGWGWPWLDIERVCATLGHLGYQNNAGHRIWSQNVNSVYMPHQNYLGEILALRDPWGGAYLYQYTEWANVYEYKRDFIPEVPDQSGFDPLVPLDPDNPPYPFTSSSIFVDCPCWWMKVIDPDTGWDMIPACDFVAPRVICRNPDGSLYEEGSYLSQATYSHDHLRVDDFELCLSIEEGDGTNHGPGYPRYYEHGGAAHFTWGVFYTPDGTDPDTKYFRFDYIKPASAFVSTWQSPALFSIQNCTLDGQYPATRRFAELPGMMYKGKRLLVGPYTRLVEVTTKVVLEREED
jgi:hypothetical protein